MSAKRKQKALKPIVVGRVSIPRYQLGDGRVMIAYPTRENPRKLKTFVDPKEAADFAELKARELNNSGQEAQIFEAADRADYSQAKNDVAPYCVRVHVATAEWAEAKKAIAGRHKFTDVVAAGLKLLDRVPHPVPNVVKEFYASKEKQDLHGGYRNGMKSTWDKFAEAFPGDIRGIKAPQIEKWLDGEVVDGTRHGGRRKPNGDMVGSRRRDNILKHVRSLFSYARLHSYLPDEISEAKKVPLIDQGVGEISFFTIGEMRLILEHVKEEWLPYVVLMVFNGFRSEELVKQRLAKQSKDPLRWDDFDWEENEICVRKATSKIGRPRIVPLQEATREWLAPYRRASGLIAPEKKRADNEFGKGERLERAINRALQAAPMIANTGPKQLEMPGVGREVEDELVTSFEWRHNALRHSYGSYRASILKNEHALAEEMGTSVGMIREHYRNPRPMSQARAWFALRPKSSGIIVPFPAGATA